jgi:anti-sigma regulatory factor (Ser/Thr protein kinase)
MIQSLSVDGKRSRTVRVKVNPQAEFRSIIHVFDSIEIPQTGVSPDNLKFAILELVNNSIRAHKERGDAREILIDITLTEGRLHFAIRDFGGGFDPKLLPYPLDASPSTLDIHSESFQDYQKRNGYKRFGMGIYLAKKTFEHFQLLFLDSSDVPVRWGANRVAGTLIRLDIAAREESDGK